MCRPMLPDDYTCITVKLEDWRNPQILKGSDSSSRIYEMMYESLGSLSGTVKEVIQNARKDYRYYEGNYRCLLDAKVVNFTIVDSAGHFQLTVNWEDKTVKWSIRSYDDE